MGELVRQEQVADALAARKQHERIKALRASAKEQEATVAEEESKANVVSQAASGLKKDAAAVTDAIEAEKLKDTKQEQTAERRVEDATKKETQASARESKSKEDLFKAEMNTDTLEKA